MILLGRSLGTSYLRLLPKLSGVRAIVNMGRKQEVSLNMCLAYMCMTYLATVSDLRPLCSCRVAKHQSTNNWKVRFIFLDLKRYCTYQNMQIIQWVGLRFVCWLTDYCT